ncbi:cation-transporting P-type ATPase [Dulcicalothrix desertica]|uniref:cation-transporting P-type ATPase n=1 Tax=Dulcicalothrix desertica TaxID=32056 RepID=UPI001F3528FE|nr:cation-transporting P-type ATPase [Dulcicalothrix desertica]
MQDVRYGYNELPPSQRHPLLLRFVNQLTHFMALLLWVAGTLPFISQTHPRTWLGNLGSNFDQRNF